MTLFAVFALALAPVSFWLGYRAGRRSVLGDLSGPEPQPVDHGGPVRVPQPTEVEDG